MRAVLVATCLLALQAQQPPLPTRLPPQKLGKEFESPNSWSMRERLDPVTKRTVEYDPKPRIEPIDKQMGWYALKWIGRNGRELVIKYQRPDALEVTVRADVKHTRTGSYEYTYYATNSPASGQELHGFEIQTFGARATPAAGPGLFVGTMNAPFFKDGTWWRYALTTRSAAANPGGTSTFKLSSPSPPGLVECSVDGGTRGMQGVGEEMPGELEALLPGYEAWPRGKTVGPDERLATLSADEKVGRLLEWLPEFRKLRWMTIEVRARYEATLRARGIAGLIPNLEPDLAAHRITEEVAILIGQLGK